MKSLTMDEIQYLTRVECVNGMQRRGVRRGGVMNDDWGGCGCGDNDEAASVSTYGPDLAHLAHPLPHP